MIIYLLNETDLDITVSSPDNIVTVRPCNNQLFEIADMEQLVVDEYIVIGPEVEDGIEVTDIHMQIAGIGGEYLDKYAVPETADYAFSIVPYFTGDGYYMNSLN